MTLKQLEDLAVYTNSIFLNNELEQDLSDPETENNHLKMQKNSSFLSFNNNNNV